MYVHMCKTKPKLWPGLRIYILMIRHSVLLLVSILIFKINFRL
jgi:hypothetical protein